MDFDRHSDRNPFFILHSPTYSVKVVTVHLFWTITQQYIAKSVFSMQNMYLVWHIIFKNFLLYSRLSIFYHIFIVSRTDISNRFNPDLKDINDSLPPSTKVTSQDIVFENARTSGLIWKSSLYKESRNHPQPEEKTRNEPGLEYVFSGNGPQEDLTSGVQHRNRHDGRWPPTRPPDSPREA